MPFRRVSPTRPSLMNVLKTTLAAALLAFNGLSFAADTAPVEANRLLETLQMERVLQQSIEASLDMQIQQNPQIAPFREVMLSFMAKYMSYASLKDDLIQVYARSFTGAELMALREFYQTPVGRKAMERLPTLLAEGMQIGQQRVQAHLGELQDMMKAEGERLRALQQQQSQQPPQATKEKP